MSEARDIHKWFVFISVCVVLAVQLGYIFSFGALFVDILRVFQVPRSQASLVQSIAIAVSLFAGLFVGPMMHKLGMLTTGLIGCGLASGGPIMSFFATSVPYLMISIGVVGSIGTIILVIVSGAIIGIHFVESDGKAELLLSIASACGAAGGMVYPFGLAYLSDNFGLHGTLLIVGGICLNNIPAAMLWIKPHRLQEDDTTTRGRSGKCIDTEKKKSDVCENGIKIDSIDVQENSKRMHGTDEFDMVEMDQNRSTTDGTKDGYTYEKSLIKSWKRIIKNKCYVVFVVGFAITYPSVMLMLTFMVDVFLDSGLTEDEANFGLFLLNAFSIIGRLLPGFLLNSKYINVLMVPSLASLITAISMIGLIFFNALIPKLMFASLAGVAFGMNLSSISVMPMTLLGPYQYGNASGLLFAASGLTNLVAGPVSGVIRDETGSYLIVFLLASGNQVIGVILFMVAMHYQKRNSDPLATTKGKTTSPPSS